MSELKRPFRPVDLTDTPIESFDLESLAEAMRGEPAYLDQGRSAITLLRDEHMTVILEVLSAGHEMPEHHSPSSGMVTLRSGRATFSSGSGSQDVELRPGSMVGFGKDVKHTVRADEDSVCLIVIGGRVRPV